MAAPQQAVPVIYTNDSSDPQIKAYQAHQKTAARPAVPDEARTMVGLAKFGLLSTLTARGESPITPNGSVVEFATDPVSGAPVFSVSTLSPHCADMAAQPIISLAVLQPGFAGIADRRITINGSVRPVTEEECPALREAYLKKYPDAFYVDFGDFKWFIMDSISECRYYGGFGAAVKISPAEYSAARMDPVGPFSAPVAKHMNADHDADHRAMISHYVGMDVESATMLDLDRLGMNFQVKYKGESFKLRLPFPMPAEERKGIKDAIVAMTKTAAATKAAGANGCAEATTSRRP